MGDWLKSLFYDEIKADYLFDNGFHFRSFTEKSWVKKKLSDEEVIENETEWLERRNCTSCMRILRNGKQIQPITKTEGE